MINRHLTVYVSQEKLEWHRNDPQGNGYKHFAGKFAIKEATIKAIDKKIQLLQIKTYHKESKPKVSIVSEKIDLKVSVSHDGDYAIAIVFSKIN